MGGIKTKGRGPDKKKRKSRTQGDRSRKMSPMISAEVPKKNILRNIIKTVSDKVKKEKFENWSLDIDPAPRTPILGRHVFLKDDDEVEIDLKKL